MYTVILILPIILIVMANILSLLKKRDKAVGKEANILIIPSLSVILTKVLFGHHLIVFALVYLTTLVLITLLVNIIVYNGVPIVEE